MDVIDQKGLIGGKMEAGTRKRIITISRDRIVKEKRTKTKSRDFRVACYW